MRCGLLLVLGLCAGCRAPVSIPRDVPLDFEALPGPTTFSAEATLSERWAGPLRALWDQGVLGEFAGVDGVVVRYSIHRANPSKGAVVLLGGQGEAMLKYAEMVDDLLQNGYSVYAFDHRGQGASDRLLPNRDKSYVLWFDDFVTDAETFVRDVVRRDESQVFVIATSMGGAVAVLLADAHPELVTAMALAAPMMEINPAGFPPSIASSVGAAACSASDGTAYAVGQTDFKENPAFVGNVLTYSADRWTWKAELLRNNPTVRLGGLTWRWLCEALIATSRIQKLGRFSEVPTLILQAAEDQVVKPAGQDRFCSESPRCQLSRLVGARHDIFQESDPVRDRALEQMLKFFAAKATQ